MNRIAVIGGGGAMGGLVAAHLARAGKRVTVVARGAALAALQHQGLTLLSGEGHWTAPVHAVGTLAEAGDQDVLILAVKAYQLPGLAAELATFLAAGPGCRVVPLQNGLPFWYWQGNAAAPPDRVLTAVDPSGALLAALPAGRIIGCVAWPAAEVAGPGVIRHLEGRRFVFGRVPGPAPATDDAVARLAALFTAAGLRGLVSADLHADIWLKLLGNLSFNPLTALTRGHLQGLCEDPALRAVAATLMTEGAAVAAAQGIALALSVEERLAAVAKVGPLKTSMLKDLEAGRPLEHAALLGSVLEVAAHCGVAAPTLALVHALVRHLDQRTQPGQQPA